MKHKAGRDMSGSSYRGFLKSLVGLLEEARRFSARSVNAVMTATYWEIGRRIVEFEQEGKAKAAYGERLIDQLARDLSDQFGRGFSRRNLFQIRLFYLAYREKVQTVSAQLGPVTAMRPAPAGKVQTPSAESSGTVLSRKFPLLICCGAFRAKAGEFTNLTLKKIPNAVLNRCEFSKDDYSLRVENLPKAPHPGPLPLGEREKRSSGQQPLFGEEGEP